MIVQNVQNANQKIRFEMVLNGVFVEWVATLCIWNHGKKKESVETDTYIITLVVVDYLESED